MPYDLLVAIPMVRNILIPLAVVPQYIWCSYKVSILGLSLIRRVLYL